jgi:hypothetical protein
LPKNLAHSTKEKSGESPAAHSFRLGLLNWKGKEENFTANCKPPQKNIYLFIFKQTNTSPTSSKMNFFSN